MVVDESVDILGQRFWSKVREADGCWIWIASIFKGSGYGKYRTDAGATGYAHRLSWEAAKGGLNDKARLRHLCGNFACVNPDHMAFITRKPTISRSKPRDQWKPRGRRVPLVARFWSKVNKSDNCWEWRAGRNTKGYGVFNMENAPRLAHRVAYEMLCGKIPAGLFLCHHCDNPACVRPDHMFIGTASDNNWDMVRKGRGRYGKNREASHED